MPSSPEPVAYGSIPDLAFKLKDNNEIKSLSLDGNKLISKGSFVPEKALSESSVMVLKKDLEKLVTSDMNKTFLKDRKLQIKNLDTGVKLDITETKKVIEPIETEVPIEEPEIDRTKTSPSKMDQSEMDQSKTETEEVNPSIFSTTKTLIGSFFSDLTSYIQDLRNGPKLEKEQKNKPIIEIELKPLTEIKIEEVETKVKKTTTKDLEKPTIDKIIDIKEAYNLNIVANKTFDHNAEQLKVDLDTNPIITKVLLISLVAAALAGTIGIGAILPHLGLIAPSLGIVGLPLPVTITLLALGALSVVSYGSLRVAAKKSEKAKNYLEDIHLTKSRWFLESNLNDTTNSILFILMTLSVIHSPWLTTLKGCLAYPSGMLLIASGGYQLGESYKALKNANSTKDPKQIAKAVLNTIASVAIIAMGIFTTIGMLNSPINIAITCLFGAAIVLVSGMNLKDAVNQLKDIKKIDATNTDKIYEFLEETLSLSLDELHKLKDKTNEMNSIDIVKWIQKNDKNFEVKQRKIFREIQRQLANDEIKEDTIQMEELKKMIYTEDMKKALEAKIEDFGSIVTKDTLEQVFEILEEYKIGKTTDAETKILQDKMKKLFANIKSQTITKSIAEIIKFFVIYLPMMIVPFLPSIIPTFNLKVYDILMAAFLTSNIAVNITPRFRNIPPTTRKIPLSMIDDEKIKTIFNIDVKKLDDEDKTDKKITATADEKLVS